MYSKGATLKRGAFPVGLLVQAICHACQYEVVLHISTDAASHVGTPYDWPYVCFDCRTIVSADLSKNRNHCSNCGCEGIIPYEAEKLKRNSGHLFALQSAHEALRGQRRYCPRCKRVQLQFKDLAIHA